MGARSGHPEDWSPTGARYLHVPRSVLWCGRGSFSAGSVIGTARTQLARWIGIARASRTSGCAQALCAVGLLLMAASSSSVRAAPAFQVPELRGHVNDYAFVLSGADTQRLETRLREYEAKTGHQFALLTVPSLNGVPLEQYSIGVAQAWRLGRAKADDGLLMVVAIIDRKARIEVGYGLEGVIPDAIAARVVRETLKPAFVENAFASGIDAGFEVLIKATDAGWRRLHERILVQPTESLPWKWVLLPLLLPLLLFRLLGGGGSRPRGDPCAIRSVDGRDRLRRGDVSSPLDSGFAESFSSRTGGSSSGGGGGYSGGGGSFGGGGASGSW